MPTGSLGSSGKALWEKVHADALKAGDSEEVAAKKSWAAVKKAGWSKQGDKWVKMSDVIPEFSMYFTKATQNKKWSMTASDTLLDLRDEAMSLELYKSFIDNIDTDKPVPKPFDALVTDSYWNGGTPYLSIAHYSDLEGEGIPGDVEVVYVDGNQLKAKGKFNDTPLGLAAWKSVVEDKSKAEDERVRVSIAFIDLKHRHGNMVFERKSFEDVCPLCVEGAKNKTYLEGYLVHLAMTRKPVNPRSEVEVELSMTTRKEDAKSIVGEELATELAEKQKAMVGLSAVLIERADEEVVPDEPKAEPVEEPKKEDADTVSTDEVPAVEKVEEPAVEPEKVEEVTPVVAESMGETPIYRPTSLKEMVDAKAAREELYMIQDAWYMTEEVIYNILSSDEVKDKKKAITSVLGEFKSAMATKSLVDMFAEKSTDKSPIDTKYSELSLAIKSAVEQNVSADEKLMAIQPALNELAATIQEEVRKPTAVETNTETVSTSVGVEEVVNKAIQPILEQMAMVMDMVSKQNAAPITERRVPQPRAISPLAVKSLVAERKPRERTPIERIADKSVGLISNE